MGRITVLVLLFLVTALAARVLFFEVRGADETDSTTMIPSPTLPTRLPEHLPAPAPAQPKSERPKTITLVDSDPDLDQDTEAAECQDSPEQPSEPRPQSPAPH